MGDDRAAVYVEGDTIVYRASAVGMCDKALIAIRQGVTPLSPPEWLQEKMQEGTESESLIVEQARRTMREGQVVSTQDVVEIPVWVKEDGTKVVIRGHTDGTLWGVAEGTHTERYWGIEAKKLGPSLWGKWQKGMNTFFDAMPYYRDQLVIYMEGLGYPFLYAVGRWDPDEGVVTEVDVEVVSTPPGSISEIKARIIQIELAAASGVMPTCSGGMYPCPVYFIHDEDERDQGDEALDAAVDVYLEAAALEREAKAWKERAYEDVFKLAEDVDAEKLEVSGALVTKYQHKSRRLDTKAVEKAGIDLSPFYNESFKNRVKITPKKAEE
jgi:hypothetical protein